MLIYDGEPLELHGIFRFTRGKHNHVTAPRDFCCLGYRVYGNAHFNYEGKDIYVPEHSAVFIGHNVEYFQETEGEEVIAVHFDTLDRREMPFIDALTHENKKLLDEQFIRLYEIWNEKKEGYKTRCMSLLYEILYLTGTSTGRNENISEGIKKGMAYITTNFTDKDISVAKAAQVSNVSEVYFRKIFLKHYGISPMKYIINLRLDYAKELLFSGYFSVADVAGLSGFSDPKYFCTCFKREVGETPGKYLPRV